MRFCEIETIAHRWHQLGHMLKYINLLNITKVTNIINEAQFDGCSVRLLLLYVSSSFLTTSLGCLSYSSVQEKWKKQNWVRNFIWLTVLWNMQKNLHLNKKGIVQERITPSRTLGDSNEIVWNKKWGGKYEV